MRMLDLCCGRFGWGKAFAARGWEVVGVDLVEPPDVPNGCTFLQSDVFEWRRRDLRKYDFVCASTPCEEFSKWGMRCFNPNPPHPELGIKLFNYTRFICEGSGALFVMENVRAAQKFVGNAKHHCGPFYLWGNGVPPLMPQGIIKGMTRRAIGHKDYKGQPGWNTKNTAASTRLRESSAASMAATIPSELASCVADYAERICQVPA